MGSLILQPVELEVEQTAVGELVDAELLAEVYDSPTTAAAERNHMVGLQAEYRPGGTWVEHP
jgi:hypothetical protein